MNKNTPQEMIAIIQAHLDGKQLQCWSKLAGENSGEWVDTQNPTFCFPQIVYRIKPVPKKVPLTQADIPLDRLVWLHTTSDDIDLVESIDVAGIRTWYTRYTFDALFNKSCTISFDGGKTWQKCEKEAAE